MSLVLKDSEGNKWEPFIMGYETDEGLFSTLVYATSQEHALLIIEDIRQSAVLIGKVERNAKPA